MMRTVRFVLASALAGLAVAASPAIAQDGYTATLAQPATEARIVARETLWRCAGAACRAPRTGLSADMTECRALARKVGRLAGFAVAAAPFDAAQIARCNAGLAD